MVTKIKTLIKVNKTFYKGLGSHFLFTNIKHDKLIRKHNISELKILTFHQISIRKN